MFCARCLFCLKKVIHPTVTQRQCNKYQRKEFILFAQADKT